MHRLNQTELALLVITGDGETIGGYFYLFVLSLMKF